MVFNTYIWIWEHQLRVDNADEQMKRDIGTPTEDRYIGGGRDKSAPTGDRMMVSNAMIGPYGCPG
jgi:hypothetical protein